NTNDRAPFGEARTHLTVVLETVAQPIESFRDGFFSRARQRFRAVIYFDPRNDALLPEQLSQRRCRGILLMDGLVLHDDPANGLGDARCCKEHFAISSAAFRRRADFQSIKALC